jgi:thiol-disulfide isomerase/thioredoxin
MIKQFAFLILLLVGVSCQQAQKQNQVAVLEGTSVYKGGEIRFQNYSTSHTAAFFHETINNEGIFKLEAMIPEAFIVEARVYEDRHFKKSFSCFMEPGKTLEVEVGEKDLNYKGELKSVNDFFIEYNTTLLRAFYKFYKGASLTDFQSIDDAHQHALSLLNNNGLSEEANAFFRQLTKYSFDGIKFKSIVNSGMTQSEWPDEVIDFVKKAEHERFSSIALMSVQDYMEVLKNYYTMLELYNPGKYDFSQLTTKINWIENRFVQERYAIYLSDQLIHRAKGLDGTTRNIVEQLSGYIKNEYSKKTFEQLINKLTSLERKFNHLLPGKPAPTFVFEDKNGNSVSLEQFEGKYVFLDVWNIYCGPCIKQIPYLKKYEKALHNYPIEFVAVSCDKQEEKQKWQNFVKEKEMVGYQLIMDKGRDSQFLEDYAIQGFPTFILIDPEGKIVDYKFIFPENPEFLDKLKSIMDTNN